VLRYLATIQSRCHRVSQRASIGIHRAAKKSKTKTSGKIPSDGGVLFRGVFVLRCPVTDTKNTLVNNDESSFKCSLKCLSVVYITK